MAKRYEEIGREILSRIDSGEWAVGYKLPREVDLCRIFDASRTTVRRALSGLVRDGRLRRVKGTGTFVSTPQILEKSTLFLQSFSEELKSRGLHSVSEVLEFRMLPSCDGAVASGLSVKEGSRVLKVRRLRYSEELLEKGPITLTTSYFPPDVGEALLSSDLEHESLYHALRARKILRVRSEKTIAVASPSGAERRLLSAGEGDAFFLVTTRSYDRAGQVIEYCESYYPADRNVFTIHITTE